MKIEIDRKTLSSDELKVVDLLSSTIPHDELVYALDMNVSQAQALLGIMEIKGISVENRA